MKNPILVPPSSNGGGCRDSERIALYRSMQSFRQNPARRHSASNNWPLGCVPGPPAGAEDGVPGQQCPCLRVPESDGVVGVSRCGHQPPPPSPMSQSVSPPTTCGRNWRRPKPHFLNSCNGSETGPVNARRDPGPHGRSPKSLPRSPTYRDVLGDQTYESLAHKGETMTTAAMVTYAYDQIDQARTTLEAVSK